MDDLAKVFILIGVMIIVAAVVLCVLPLSSTQEMTITGVINDNMNITQSGRGSQTIRGLPNGELDINGVRLRGHSPGRKIRQTNGKLYVDGKLMKNVGGEWK